MHLPHERATTLVLASSRRNSSNSSVVIDVMSMLLIWTLEALTAGAAISATATRSEKSLGVNGGEKMCQMAG
jgi:hypothetical protein